MTIKTATELVVLVENLFGWSAVGAVDDASLRPTARKVPLWKARAAEAGKINRAMKKDPKVVTLANLEIAANYCFEKRIDVKSPYGLVYKIEEAVKHVTDVELTTDVGESVQRALAWEADQPATPSRDEWISRMTRAHGDSRLLVLAEWKADGRG